MKNYKSPFLEGGESVHNYKGRGFVVDYYRASWQCSDSQHIVRGRGSTKQEAVREAHYYWDEYIKRNQL